MKLADRILKAQQDGRDADPLTKKQFMEMMNSATKVNALEMRLLATIGALMNTMDSMRGKIESLKKPNLIRKSAYDELY